METSLRISHNPVHFQGDSMNLSIFKTAAVAATAIMMGAFGVAPASAGDYDGNFLVRLQGTYVVTQDTANSIKLNGTELRPGQDAEVSNEVIPTLTLSYFLNKNVAVELFCCFAKVDVTGQGSVLGPLGKLADTWIFPPILTLQYHFDQVGGFKPYVGAGVEYIHYFNSKPGKNVGGSVDFSDSWGFALQAGFDYQLGKGWYLNADIKKVWLDTDVTWHNPLAAGNVIKANVDVDPLIVSVGVGYRFNIEDLLSNRRSEPLK